MITDSLNIETAFYDIDSCDVVWHGHYVKYFERARCQLLDKIGYNYQAMREDGYYFPVINIQIKYIKPLVFSQAFRVDTTLVEWENRLKIKYLNCRSKRWGKNYKRADSAGYGRISKSANVI